MFNCLVVVAAVLLVGTKVDTGNVECRDADELNTTDINMDELVNKRLYVLVESSPDYARQTNFRYGDLHVVNSANSTYTWDATMLHRDLGTLSFPKQLLSYKNGIMKVTPYFSDGLRNDQSETWYILAQTDERAMLIVFCPDYPLPEQIDFRIIVVPSNNTLDEVATYRQVPVNYVLSKQSLDKLLAVDASYHFIGQMRMQSYALQDIKKETTSSP